jgi:threonine/homoserine/homoserine lactone efflux protein
MDGSFLTFLGVSILVIVAPGPDTALTIRNTLRGGRAAGIGTALGVSTGQLIWAVATSVGLVAVLLASEPVFRAVRLAGAAYLIWLGLQSLRVAFSARRPRPPVESESARGRLRSRAAFVQGIVNNLGNPKMAVFFASVLPQFTAPGQGMGSALVLLGFVFSVMTLAWLTTYAVVIATAGRLLRVSRVQRSIEAVSGVVLVGLGARVAIDAR